MQDKPPLGIMPAYIFYEGLDPSQKNIRTILRHRLSLLTDAIIRYRKRGFQIKWDWIKEYIFLCKIV